MRGRAGVWLLCLVLSSWGVGGGAATLVLNPVDGVGGSDGMVVASRTMPGAGGLLTNPTATATPSPPPPPPSDPLIYPVPRSPVTLTFFNYGNPVPRNPALICIGAAENDFWERAAATGAKLDKAVGQTLEYRFRRVHLTVVPVGEVRGLRWRSIRPMVLGLRYFVDTYGAMDMLFDISVEGMGTGRVGTGRLTTV